VWVGFFFAWRRLSGHIKMKARCSFWHEKWQNTFHLVSARVDKAILLAEKN